MLVGQLQNNQLLEAICGELYSVGLLIMVEANNGLLKGKDSAYARHCCHEELVGDKKNKMKL